MHSHVFYAPHYAPRIWIGYISRIWISQCLKTHVTNPCAGHLLVQYDTCGWAYQTSLWVLLYTSMSPEHHQERIGHDVLWVMSYVLMNYVTQWFMSRIWMSHVTLMNPSGLFMWLIYTTCDRSKYVRYSRLQIGWHRILRLFVQLCQRARILPMGFTISTM